MRGPRTGDKQQQQLARDEETSSSNTGLDCKDESRLARVKRALLGQRICSPNDAPPEKQTPQREQPRASSGRCFGAPIELAVLETGLEVPKTVCRLCGYIEENGGFREPALFRLTTGGSRQADKLRLAFERKGDADLEGAANPAEAALLLRQWIKELPEPVVGRVCVAKLLQIHVGLRNKNRERWIRETRQLLQRDLPTVNLKLLGYLLNFLGRFEAQHGSGATGVSGIFAPLLLPHVPPATLLLRDLVLDAAFVFPDYASVKEPVNGAQIASSTSVPVPVVAGADLHQSSAGREFALCCAANNKRKERRDSGGEGHERKLIRSNSEDKIWESTGKISEDKDSVKNSSETIRRVSSHEDFNSAKHHHILSKLQKDMGHGLLHGGSLPLQERTNLSPVSSKTSVVHHSSDVVLASEKFDCDAERLRNSERFSRSLTPRGRRHVRRRKLHINTNYDNGSSKENDFSSSDVMFTLSSDSSKSGSKSQSFLEMLSGGASRSPSPVRPTPLEHDEANNPTPSSNWSFPIRQSNAEELDERVVAMTSPRNSIVTPRRFYSEDEAEDRETRSGLKEYGLKTLMKQINSLKKKIRKYEGEFEDNFGYRPSHSDKMSNRDIKRIVSELNRVRKEHKILKEGYVGTLLTVPKFCRDENSLTANNNNVEDDKARSASIAEMVGEIEKNLAEKRYNYNRSENLEDLTYEQLLDEKTAAQKALLSIENTFGRLVSKDDRAIVRPLSDRYRILKRLLIRAGANQDSISELATILEHETMDFSSTTGIPIDCDRRASEPDMSHRGILDCIESMEQVQTDSDSAPSSSESSRGIVESLHSLPKDELLLQQRITKEEKRRLRRALKELEIQFEARAGRRMKREDRGPQVSMVYDSYKQTKAKLRLISALLAKNS